MEELLVSDSGWVAPILWKSEFRNILAGCEYDIDSLDVLKLVRDSDCSAYDCEFVALAKHLGVKLVTMDNKILRSFPEIAQSLCPIDH